MKSCYPSNLADLQKYAVPLAYAYQNFRKISKLLCLTLCSTLFLHAHVSAQCTFTGISIDPVCEGESANVVLSGLPASSVFSIAYDAGPSNGQVATLVASDTEGTAIFQSIPLTVATHNGTNLTITSISELAVDGCTLEPASGNVAGLVVNSLPLISVQATDTICQSDQAFMLTASPLGGEWSGNVTPEGFLFPNLMAPGTQSFVYTYTDDATGCFTFAETTVEVLPNPSVVATNVIDGSCDFSTGGVKLSGNGTVPLSYSVDGLNFGASDTFGNLVSGFFTAYVEDSFGCVGSTTFEIGNESNLTGGIVAQTNPGCFNSESGTLSVFANGGDIGAGYEFKLDFQDFGPESSFSGLGPGTHIVTIRDDDGCKFVVNTLLTESDEDLEISINSQTSSGCVGPEGGTIAVDVTGGIPPFEFSIDNGLTFDESNVISGLSDGFYRVFVRDANGCVKFTTVNIGIQLDVVVNNSAVCANNGAGSITVNASGGQAPYQYSIDGQNFGGGNTFTGLSAGIYTVFVTDNNGCEGEIQVTMEPSNSSFTAELLTSDIICEGDGDDGAILVLPSGGVPPYTYKLNAGAFGPDSLFTGLPAGQYLISIRDAANCKMFLDAFIDEAPSALNANLDEVVDNVCKGDESGSATISASGGKAPYRYSIDGTNFTSQSTFSGLAAGVYTATVKDGLGCTSTVPFIITEPTGDVISLTSSDTVNVLCKGEATGGITLVAAGGVAPYKYSVDGGETFFTTAEFTGLAAGTYMGYVFDANGCVATTSFEITEPANALSGRIIDQFDLLCKGDSDGEVTVDGLGGVPPYEYSIDSIAFSNNPTFLGLAAGSYNVTIRDTNGCTVQVPVDIAEPVFDLAVTLDTVENVLCKGESTGSLTFSATGGTPGYLYSLDALNFISSGIFEDLKAGDYTVTVRDRNECEVTEIVSISEPTDSLVATVDSLVDATCGQTTGALQIAASGGTPGYLFSIDGGLNFTSNGLFIDLAPGNYTVIVRDSSNCETSVSAIIRNFPSPVIDNVDVTDISCKGDSTGSIVIFASSGTPPFQYSIDSVFTDTTVFLNLIAGTYTVSVRDSNNCLTTQQVTLSDPAEPLTAMIVEQTSENCEDQDGSVSVQAMGGTPSYIYSIDGGLTANTTGLFTGLSTGQYTVSISDFNGCFDSINVEITNFCCPRMDSVVVSRDTLCEGDTVSLSARIQFDDGGTLRWERLDPNGGTPIIIPDPNNVVFNLDSCLSEKVQVRAIYTSAQDTCPPIISDTLDIMVYPQITYTTVADSTCNFEIFDLCPGFIVSWSDDLGNSGTGTSYVADFKTQGTVTFVITNPGAPASLSCAEEVITWNFDCPPVDCAITEVGIGSQTACNGADNTFTQTLVVFYEAEPDSGFLVVNGVNFPILGSPQTVILDNLPSTGQPVDLEIRFTEEPECAFLQEGAFLAPQPCGEIECALTSYSPEGFAVSITGVPGVDDPMHKFDFDGSIAINSDGEARLSGTLYNVSNPGIRWFLDVFLVNPDNWALWSLKGRTYFADAETADIEAANTFFETWRFWEMASDSSTITGIGGAVDGLVLNLSHSPADFKFGFQLGFAANNRNALYGMHGMFNWSATINGEPTTNVGEMSTLVACDENVGNLTPVSIINGITLGAQTLAAPFTTNLAIEEGTDLTFELTTIDRESNVSYRVNGLPANASITEIANNGTEKKVMLDFNTTVGDKGAYTIDFITSDSAQQERLREINIQVAGQGLLPAALIYFEAIPLTDGSVNVSWETAEELSGTLFQIERSTDGTFFAVIGEVDGRGNLSGGGPFGYEYIDEAVGQTRIFYRLKQVAPNGEFLESQIVEVVFGEDIQPEIILFPNPASTNLEIRIPSFTDKVVDLLIMDLKGKIMVEEPIALSPGINSLTIDVSKYAKTIYVVRVRGEEGFLSLKRFSRL